MWSQPRKGIPDEQRPLTVRCESCKASFVKLPRLIDGARRCPECGSTELKIR